MSDPTPPAPVEPAKPPGLDARLALMLVCVAVCLFGRGITPPIALAGGIVLALCGLTARQTLATKVAKYLIQVAVVMLGLGMNLRKVGEAGLVGFAFAAGTIVGTFALGALLGRVLRTDAKLTTLLSSGTAICGGSAIAATASVIAASEAQIAVAMGCVFLLNAVALYLFPWMGHAMGMTAEQFGTWAAVAIHDVANVVGAATVFDARYGDSFGPTDAATQTATAVKLTRTLWIVPVALVCGWWFRRHGEPEAGTAKAKLPVPVFIVLFVIAAAAGTYAPVVHGWAEYGKPVSVRLMSAALFLIGCGLSVKAVASVGWRAMVLAVVLWVAISAAALWVVKATV